MLRTLILLALFTQTVSAAEQTSPESEVVRGTVNVALGNKNGIVVLTDSMLSGPDGPHPNQPGKKLFRVDERTVCAMAGFYAGPAPITDLNTSTQAIISEYIRQSATQKPQTISERLQALATTFNLYLTTIANIQDTTPSLKPPSLNWYELQLIVAGYDLDERPKIGRIVLRTRVRRGYISSETDELSVISVEAKLEKKLNGMDDVAQDLLGHPELQPDDIVLQEYATSKSNSGGEDLTVDGMKKLAERLAFYTSKVHREVGGKNQVAVFQADHTLNIEQQMFPEPPRPLANFNLVVGFSDIGNFRNTWPQPSNVPVVCVRCEWQGTISTLDGIYLIGSSYTDSFVRYDGGLIELGDTKVTNTELVIGPDAKRDSEKVRRVISGYPWKKVSYENPRLN
jgi:hypothetical protein